MIDLAQRSEPYEIALPYGLSVKVQPLTTAGMVAAQAAARRAVEAIGRQARERTEAGPAPPAPESIAPVTELYLVGEHRSLEDFADLVENARLIRETVRIQFTVSPGIGDVIMPAAAALEGRDDDHAPATARGTAGDGRLAPWRRPWSSARVALVARVRRATL
jgi:hypothetical protein